MNHLQTYFRSHLATGSVAGTSMAYIGQMLRGQATILAYIDVFFALALIAGVICPLALSLRAIDRSAPAKA